MGIRCVKVNSKKLVRAFFGCIHTARTWGTPNSGKKSIYLAADYSIILNAKVYFLWQIWKIQFEPIHKHYWLFIDEANVFEWRLHKLKGHLLEIHALKAKSDDLNWENQLQRTVLKCRKLILGNKIHVVALMSGYKVCQILFEEKKFEHF